MIPLRRQLKQVNQAATQPSEDGLSKPEEIEAFAEQAVVALKNLNFEEKRAIVMNTVDKIVGTQKGLYVHGFIPVTNHVEHQTSDRHRGTSQCGEVDPFSSAH